MRFFLPLLLALLLTVPARAEYTIARRYPIGGDASRWDYLVMSLYVAHFTPFEVLNADAGAKVGEIVRRSGSRRLFPAPSQSSS